MNYFSPPTRRALAWFCFLVHLVALGAAFFVLGGGLPPGNLAARAQFVAANAGAWQIAWATWLPASLALVLFFAAWADTLAEKYRAWAVLAVAIALAGALIDWTNEMIWIGIAPGLAARFAADAFAAGAYALWDRAYLTLSIGLANGLYCVAAFILNALAYRTRDFPRWLARLGAVVWAVAFDLSIAAFIADGAYIQIASALAFALFLPWVLLMGYGWLARANENALPASRLSFNAVVRSMIPKHPLPMRTHFRDCLLVNFAIDPKILRPLIPAPIELDLHQGKAYLSVVIAEMEKMRPAFLPRALGITYNQIVYRVVVRAPGGERGVYFLRSDADHLLMSLAGDWLTFFRFHFSPIKMTRGDGTLALDLRAPRAAIRAEYALAKLRRRLPASSRFRSFRAAKKFLVELFALFAYDPLTNELSAVHIERGEWDLFCVPDQNGTYEWMQAGPHFNRRNTRLDSIFYAREIPYHWHTLERKIAIEDTEKDKKHRIYSNDVQR